MKDESCESIVLVDEAGNEIEFDIMDEFEHKDERYCVLLPVDDDSDELEYVILRKLKADEGNTADSPVFAGIDDGTLLDEVFEKYKRRASIE